MEIGTGTKLAVDPQAPPVVAFNWHWILFRRWDQNNMVAGLASYMRQLANASIAHCTTFINLHEMCLICCYCMNFTYTMHAHTKL